MFKEWTGPLPASIEALCRWIDTGDTEKGGFKYGKKVLGLTDDALWEIYEIRKNKDWNNHRLAEIISKTRSDRDVLAGLEKI